MFVCGVVCDLYDVCVSGELCSVCDVIDVCVSGVYFCVCDVYKFCGVLCCV